MEPKINDMSYATQKSAKIRHRNFIVNALKNSPLLFSELLALGKRDNINGIHSEEGLSTILKAMVKEGIISQNATKKDSRDILRSAYTLTKIGDNLSMQIWPNFYQIDELKRLFSNFNKIQNFVEDINTGKNVFSDKIIGLKFTENKLWQFESIVKYSKFLGDDKFRERLSKYMKRFVNKKQFRKRFGKIDMDFVGKLSNSIKLDADPLDDKGLFTKLITKGRGTDVDLPIFIYIKAAKVLMFNEEEFYSKLDLYEQRLWNEYLEPHSKIRRGIDKVRGNTK
jgi:DNA-binding HxlR family transcriptional regulator